MSIRDDHISINLYSNLTDEIKGQYSYYNITKNPQQLLILMNLEEVMLWEELKKMILNKEDFRIALGSKSKELLL